MKITTFGNLISADDVKHNYGFCYKISIGDKFYIGQKSFNHGTNWKTYRSSQPHVKELLKSNEASYEVLKLCRTKKLLTYWEMYFLCVNNALIDDNCLNLNILGKFFRRDFL